MSDIQAGQGQRSQAKDLGKTRPEIQSQQHRTVMMNGTYDVQVSPGCEILIKVFKILHTLITEYILKKNKLCAVVALLRNFKRG